MSRVGSGLEVSGVFGKSGLEFLKMEIWDF